MWEKIDDTTDRMKVPGGWIVRSHIISHCNGCSVTVHQIFIVDAVHTWEIKKEK